jgi:uncharacterized protein YyaL (SSP411 family)
MSATFHFSPRPNRAHEIAWRPWGVEAFTEAARRDAPILLSISAVWCHWCHVMDETSYSDAEVIRLVNERFVPIRVDNDERPDVNARYNQGGWPTTAFLTPNGELIAGLTYVPPEQMRQVLEQVSTYYREHRDDIAAKVAELRERRRAAIAAMGPTAELSQQIVEDVLVAVADQYDPVFGGFGSEPKFPHVDAIELLLHMYERRQEADLLHMARKTLQQMCRGGLFDHVWGGFFRYSTRRDWSVPHFEKMLEDNAALVRALLRLYRNTGDAENREFAERTIAYVDAWLSDAETGAFYGSQDADEDFYRLTDEERQRREAPCVDRRAYAGWCALAASAYLDASWTLGRPELASRATRALDFVWERMWSPERGLARSWSVGGPGIFGVFADHAAFARALLDAYEVTGEREHLDRAQHVVAFMRDRFEDAERGGFWDAAPEGERLGRLDLGQKQIGDNATAAGVLLRLARFLRDDGIHDAARRTLAYFAGHQQALGIFAAGYALAVDCVLQPGPDIAIVATGDGGARLRAAALRAGEPGRGVQTLDPQRDADLLERAALPRSPMPAAYVCFGRVCSRPVTAPDGIERAVRALREAAERQPETIVATAEALEETAD